MCYCLYWFLRKLIGYNLVQKCASKNFEVHELKYWLPCFDLLNKHILIFINGKIVIKWTLFFITYMNLSCFNFFEILKIVFYIKYIHSL